MSRSKSAVWSEIQLSSSNLCSHQSLPLMWICRYFCDLSVYWATITCTTLQIRQLPQAQDSGNWIICPNIPNLQQASRRRHHQPPEIAHIISSRNILPHIVIGKALWVCTCQVEGTYQVSHKNNVSITYQFNEFVFNFHPQFDLVFGENRRHIKHSWGPGARFSRRPLYF